MGETTKTFPVTIADNATANAPNKTIVFKLSNAMPGGSQIRTTTATLTILDNEGPGTLDFTSSAYTVLEGSGVATITVERIGAPNLKLSVGYATQAAVSAPATANSDYTPISPARTLTFNPGEMSKTFQVAIADDSNAESPENVGLVLSNPQNLSGGSAPQIGPNGPAELTINDDDVSTFEFGAPAYLVQEDAGHATITVNRTGATNIPASIGYSTSDGTATIADYTPAAGTLSFAAGETTKTFDVGVTNDAAAEANETVDLALANGDSSLLSIVDNDNVKASVQLSSPVHGAGGGASIGSPAVATVTIADDDAAAPPVGTPAGSGTPAASDTTAPKLTLKAKKIQRALKRKRLALSVRCDERCALVIVARVRMGKKKVMLVRAKATRSSGTAAKFKLKLRTKALVRLRKAMKKHGKAKVVLSVRAKDLAGNRAARSRKVTVRR